MGDQAEVISEQPKQRFRLTERQSKFARDVGGVVLGVLIALGIGEIAEAVRWQWRISSSTQAMRAELAGNRYNFAERRAYQSCVQRRLGELGAILTEARRTHRLPDIGAIGDPGRRPTETTALDTATGEGVLLHMPRAEARAYSSNYSMAAYYDQEALSEIAPWATLALLQGAPGEIDGDLLATLLDAWTQARTRARWVGLIAEQSDEALKAFGIPIEELPAGATYEALTGRIAKRNLLCSPLIVDGKPYQAKPAS
ncbi:hypothetical protein P1X14_11955 [Sphingomonas sp. AOB5]|uniref:hypothetical protein n=1 Tax=Sphingomonas sp. AOB5 TaxID=3034017 RepID=UPI0023F9CDF3|nr:hypothetical protein [Sphingomonas sp. AOB5]MDF7775962.1 hypothetical protein [Sphingomonas sp. AOB5]